MKRFIAVIMSAALLSSCATKNVSLNESFWQQKNHKVAVAAVKPAKPGVTTAGQQGLLDLAINSAMTNTMDKQISKTNLSWYYSLPGDFSQKLNARRVSAVVAGTSVEDNDKHLANIAAQHNADEVLVMRLAAVGVIRKYYSFIPTGAPEAYVVLNGELIDPRTKQVKWRHSAEVKLPVHGEWDQPPNYPNVTAAINEAVATSRQEMLDSFFSGH